MTSAAASLAMLERRQQVLANNLANVNTHGFKREMVFARLIEDAVAATDTRTDFSAGTLTQTGNPLDLAMEGNGFFVIGTENGERLVRGGSFQIDGSGRVVDRAGNPLLGKNGEIRISKNETSPIDIAQDGTISIDGKRIDQLRLEQAPENSNPLHEGGVRFVPENERSSIPNSERRIRQGHLEESNVNPMEAMTSMIQVLHRFGAAQKTISTLDAVRGIAVNDLGKPV